MTRLLSILAAIIVLASATAEIASFVIDHKSWIKQNYDDLHSYFFPQQPSAGKNETESCAQEPSKVAQPKCDDLQSWGERLRCRATSPKTEPNVAGKDCGMDRPHPQSPASKGDVASAASVN